jgi:hypothetical protein
MIGGTVLAPVGAAAAVVVVRWLDPIPVVALVVGYARRLATPRSCTALDEVLELGFATGGVPDG